MCIEIKIAYCLARMSHTKVGNITKCHIIKGANNERVFSYIEDDSGVPAGAILCYETVTI